MDPLTMPYEAAELWLANWRTAHPDDDRADLDLWLSADYHEDSPYWPLYDARGTLIDFNVPAMQEDA